MDGAQTHGRFLFDTFEFLGPISHYEAFPEQEGEVLKPTVKEKMSCKKETKIRQERIKRLL